MADPGSPYSQVASPAVGSADEQLRAAWDAYSALADSCPDIISRFDRRLAHVYVNRAAERATGLPRERMLGRTNRELGMPGELCDLWEDTFARVFGTGEPARMEFAFDGPRGRRWYESRVVPECGPDGAVTHIVAVTRDETERNELQLRLERQITENARMARREAALRRVAERVARGDALFRVFHVAAEEAARLLGAQAAWVLARTGESDAREVAAWSAPGVERQRPDVATLLAPGGLLSAADATLDGRFGTRGVISPTGGLVPGTEVMAAAAPVIVRAEVWGHLVVAWTGDGTDEDAEEMLGPVAELVGMSLLNHETASELDRLARTDPLTGLANRRAFFDRLGGEVNLSGRHGHPVSLVIIDVDHFKRVNDVFGHAAGDRTLIEVSRRLGGGVRRGELLARIGGEEFAWLLPRSDIRQATSAAERARSEVAREPVPGVGPLTLSAGVATLTPGEEVETLVRRADDALYRAKNTGRDRVEVA